MLLEGITVLFLSSRSDVLQLRQVTSKANAHVYKIARQMLREFTVEQLIYFINKTNQVTMTMDEGGLSHGVYDKGYHALYHEYVKLKMMLLPNSPQEDRLKLIYCILPFFQLWESV